MHHLFSQVCNACYVIEYNLFLKTRDGAVSNTLNAVIEKKIIVRTGFIRFPSVMFCRL